MPSLEVTDTAEAVGSIVAAVDPRQTSQRCNTCGHVHRRNRPTQAIFRCQSCGYEVNADLNGARNVAWKYHANIGKPDAGGQSTLSWGKVLCIFHLQAPGFSLVDSAPQIAVTLRPAICTS